MPRFFSWLDRIFSWLDRILSEKKNCELEGKVLLAHALPTVRAAAAAAGDCADEVNAQTVQQPP